MAESRGNPKLQVRLPEGIIQLLDQACGGEKGRQDFMVRMITSYCTPEAERERQHTGTYEEGLKRGRTQGQRYAEMAYFLSTMPLDSPLPTPIAQWAADHPLDWMSVQRLLLNSPSATAFATWYAQHDAHGDRILGESR